MPTLGEYAGVAEVAAVRQYKKRDQACGHGAGARKKLSHDSSRSPFPADLAARRPLGLRDVSRPRCSGASPSTNPPCLLRICQVGASADLARTKVCCCCSAMATLSSWVFLGAELVEQRPARWGACSRVGDSQPTFFAQVRGGSGFSRRSAAAPRW